MALDFWDSLFDVDGDGKITDFDFDLDYFLYNQVMNDDEEKDDSWKYETIDGSDYGVSPDDYDTEEEYLDALELEVELSEDEDDRDDGLTLNVSFELGGERIDKCKKFIELKSDSVLAARYLDPVQGFLYAKAIKDNFAVPCSLPDEKDSREMGIDEVIWKLCRYDTKLAFEAWGWCIEQFGPYAELEDFASESMTNWFFDKFTYPYEYRNALVDYLHENPDKCQKALKLMKKCCINLSDYIVQALNCGYYAVAAILYSGNLKKAGSDWKSINDFIDAIIYDCRCNCEENPKVLVCFRDKLFPIVKRIKNGMVQDEIPEFESRIEQYLAELGYSESEDNQTLSENEDNRYAWRSQYENADCYGLKVEDYETAEEFQNARNQKRREEEQNRYLAEREKRFEQLKEAAQDKTLYTYCGVLVENADRIYHYLTDDETLKAGDRVLVPFGNKKIEGEIVSVGQYMKVGAPFPLERTKKIIRKI
ncbi:MAG: hypothetical protein Q3968_03575 [Clostridiaceae bacterium]|nr:hypothetical protein [Clostridiaceae bacterium]